MVKRKAILSAALVLVLATSFTSVSAAASTANAETGDTDIRSAISVKWEETLSAKLASGEITQEKYDEVIAAIESGEFRGAWGSGTMHGNRGDATELTDEQKAELSAKRAEMLVEKLNAGEITQEQYDEIIAAIESGDFIGNWANHGNIGELTEEQKAELFAKRAEMLVEKLNAGEITQEQYDEIIAAIESGDFIGNRVNHGNIGELTEEQKAEIAEKRNELAENGRFGGIWGKRGNAEELTDEQKAEIAEKQAEAAENGSFGGFRGGMRGNFGSRNK